MKVLIAAAALLLLVGCAGLTGDSQVLELVEFDEGQEGCARIQGSIGSVNVHIVQTQGDNPPPC